MPDLLAYEAASFNAAYYVQPEAGFIRLSGADRVDFLQRQTTNDLRLLTTDRAVSTVLTSPTARILDVLSVINEGETLGVISLPGRSSETPTFFRKRIFFSDQVSIDDLSSEYVQILLFGPKLNITLQNLLHSIPAPNHLAKAEINGQSVTVLAQKIFSEIGYRLLVPVPSFDDVKDKLHEIGVTRTPSEIFEILRVEAGQPGPVTELLDDYTPLEVHLDEMISDSKGCYTGQEIIARQITYDKVAKNLAGIRLSGFIEAGANLEVENKAAGTLTSIVQSPRFGPIGLGVVRRPYHEVGTHLTVQNEAIYNAEGVVVKLPFR